MLVADSDLPPLPACLIFNTYCHQIISIAFQSRFQNEKILKMVRVNKNLQKSLANINTEWTERTLPL